MMNTWNLIELQSAWSREKKNFILILDQIKVYWCADTFKKLVVLFKGAIHFGKGFSFRYEISHRVRISV